MSQLAMGSSDAMLIPTHLNGLGFADRLTVGIDAHRRTLDAQGTKGLFQQLDLAGATPNWRRSLVVD